MPMYWERYSKKEYTQIVLHDFEGKRRFVGFHNAY